MMLSGAIWCFRVLCGIREGDMGVFCVNLECYLVLYGCDCGCSLMASKVI